MMNAYLIRKRREFLYSLALMIGVLLLSKDARADHFAAADMKVIYAGIGQDPCNGKPDYTYDITLYIYTDCLGIPMYSPLGITYQSVNGNITGNVDLTWFDQQGNPAPANYTGDITTGLCPNFANQSTCNGASNVYPGYRIWEYRGTVTLPSPQTDWVFSYSSCCRNRAVINMQYDGFYIEAGINNVARYDVSTPYFTEYPLPYICVGTKYQYLNGPVDPDPLPLGQYMRVSNQNPLTGTGQPVGYNPGFTLANPVASTTGYVVNPVSGVTEFTVPNDGVYGLAFRVDKYAENNKLDPNDDIRLAYTLRDVQVAVLPCAEPPPAFTTSGSPLNMKNATWKSISGTDSAIYACPGSEISFDLIASNDNPAKKNFLYWSADNNTGANKCPGSVFTKVTNGQDTIKANFRWTPKDSDAGIDHILTVIAKDSSCDPAVPITLPTPTVYIIRVTKGLDAGPDLQTCKFNEKGYKVTLKGTEYKLRVKWSRLDGAPIRNNIDDSTSISPFLKATGTVAFLVQTPDLAGKCKVRDTLVLQEDLDNTLNAFPGDSKNNITLCRPDYLQLDAIFTGDKPLSNRSCGISSRGLDIDKIMDDPQARRKLDSALIFGSPAFPIEATYDTLGASAFNFPTLVRTQKQQFLLTREELARYGFVPSTLMSISIDMDKNNLPDHEYSNFTISLKCTDKKELKSTDGFETGLQTVYAAIGPVTFEPGWHTFDFQNQYDWDSSKNLIVEFCYHNNATVEQCNPAGPGINVMTYVPTSYVAGLSYMPMKNDANNNRIPDPDVQDVCPTIMNSEIVNHYTRPLVRFKYYEMPDADVKFYWTPGTFLSDSTLQQPLAYVPKSISYSVFTMGRSGCLLYDTVNVYVPEHDYKLTGDTTVCFGEQAVMSVNDGFTFKWFEYRDGKFEDARNSVNCTDCKNVILSPKATTTYKVVIHDSVFCQDTITTTVTVLPLPDVRILTRDTVVKYGQSIQLLASGAKMYNWMPVTGLNNANSSYPVATIKESTQYILGGIGTNGCKAYDTINVSVDTRDNVFVPSAFSPNGDGKNDMFRIPNLTFQRIVEFRVFNRWGQEVYSGNSNNGWDGTWKGVPQAAGTYNYQIRISFPDGYTESYKGDVVIIR